MDHTKQRTRQHIIADLSVHCVEGFVLRAGHTLQRLERDYGYDLLHFTFDEHGYSEPEYLPLQLKASEALQVVGSDYVYDVDIRDYNLWIQERLPVIFLMYDASRDRAYWLDFQQYFRDDEFRRPKKGAKSVRVHVPHRQAVNRRAISAWRELKWQARRRARGEKDETN